MTRPMLLALLFCANGALAQDYVVPSEPDIRGFDFPRGSIGMFSTVAVLYQDGSREMLYGFIYGNMQRDAVFHHVNDATGLYCTGTSARAEDRSGKGTLTCTRNGQAIGGADIDIPAGTYGRLNGIDSGTIHDTQGRQIGISITQWDAWKFPDPAALFARFDG